VLSPSFVSFFLPFSLLSGLASLRAKELMSGGVVLMALVEKNADELKSLTPLQRMAYATSSAGLNATADQLESLVGTSQTKVKPLVIDLSEIVLKGGTTVEWEDSIKEEGETQTTEEVEKEEVEAVEKTALDKFHVVGRVKLAASVWLKHSAHDSDSDDATDFKHEDEYSDSSADEIEQWGRGHAPKQLHEDHHRSHYDGRHSPMQRFGLKALNNHGVYTRVFRSMIFASLSHAKVSDNDLGLVLGKFLKHVHACTEHNMPEYQSTWSLGVFLVFRKPSDCAKCALELLKMVEGTHWGRLGLQGDTSVNVGVHAGKGCEM
jgi:hypothetical protein